MNSSAELTEPESQMFIITSQSGKVYKFRHFDKDEPCLNVRAVMLDDDVQTFRSMVAKGIKEQQANNVTYTITD
jgi:hypothetical protein